MNKILLSFFVSIIILTSSCSDKEVGDVEGILLTINPNIAVFKKENERVKYIIQVNSEFEIRSVEVTMQAENELDKDTLILKEPNTKNYTGELEFLAQLPPEGSDYYEITFIVTDSEGFKEQLKSLLTVVKVETELNQSEGIKLFSAISAEQQGGYNLEQRKVMSSSNITAKGLSFIDASDTTGNAAGKLSKSWKGVNGTEFVKNFNFKYSEATLESVKEAVTSSNTSDVISEIEANDIILVQYTKEDKTIDYAAILINSVTDADSTDKDAYNFNLKFVE